MLLPNLRLVLVNKCVVSHIEGCLVRKAQFFRRVVKGHSRKSVPNEVVLDAPSVVGVRHYGVSSMRESPAALTAEKTVLTVPVSVSDGFTASAVWTLWLFAGLLVI